MRSWAALAVAVVAASGAGCGDSTPEEMSRDAQVYLATIRVVVADQPPPTDPDALPIVYVIGVGEDEIAADVQAEVIAELSDAIEVRFADERAEAIVEDADGAPVKHEGVLVALGALRPETDPVEVDVEVYRSEADWSKRVLTVERRSSQWTVTSSSVLPADDA